MLIRRYDEKRLGYQFTYPKSHIIPGQVFEGVLTGLLHTILQVEGRPS